MYMQLSPLTSLAPGSHIKNTLTFEHVLQPFTEMELPYNSLHSQVVSSISGIRHTLLSIATLEIYHRPSSTSSRTERNSLFVSKSVQ